MKFFVEKVAPILKPSLKLTFRLLRVFEKTQWLSKSELEEIQQEKLVKLCRHFGIKDVRDLDDLRTLPLTSKRNLIGWKPRNNVLGRKPIPQVTSGTTGEPFRFFSDSVELAVKHALALRGWQWSGWRIGDRAVDFTIHDPPKFPKNIYHRLTGWLHLNALKSKDVYEKHYAKIIRKFKPRLIRGYPSFLAELADFLNVDSKVSAIVHGEPPQPYMSKLLKAFEVYNSYGLSECRAIAFECEHHNLHVAVEGCIVEEVNGEIVVTNLDNYVQPFIRYRTGDLGKLIPGKCKCGRELPVLSPIIGRTYETYRSPTGRIIHPFYFGLLMEKYIKYVREYQALIYPEENIIEIKVVPKQKHVMGKVKLDFIEKLFGMKAKLTIVDSIEREVSGKKLLIKIVRERSRHSST